jgi:hypothetical protein
VVEPVETTPRARVISTSSISRGVLRADLPGHSDMQLTRLARDLDASAAEVHV